VQVSENCKRVQVGDVVLVPSTDYRDVRKAAFQEYAVTTHFNAARIPSTISLQDGASLGVAFVAASLSLGISFGLDFSHARKHTGPNLSELLTQIPRQTIPDDIREECFSCSMDSEAMKPDDWLAVWGGKCHVLHQLTIKKSLAFNAD
jgi:NADPH:quinone reductase-like Zn-dependent oxidoreductase